MKGSPQPSNTCCKGQAHSHQKIQYICLQDSCMLNRLLCKSCVHESHRKHKLIEPLNRLNMNSCYGSSVEDYGYLSDRLKAICDEWQKLNEIFYSNMRQLQSGILFQLNTVMKTFTNDQIDKAYDVLMNKHSQIDQINQYVAMINFLNKDYLEDVEAVKKFADVISDRVKKVIGKTVKKVDAMLSKMQQHISELDFGKYGQFKNYVDHQASDKDEKGHDEPEFNKKEAQDDTNTQRKSLKLDNQQGSSSNKQANNNKQGNNKQGSNSSSKRKGSRPDLQQPSQDYKSSSNSHSHSTPSRQGFQKYK